MKSRILYTKGTGTFEETVWIKPDITSNQIEVRSIMTGVCRSDIEMMQGTFGPLPLEMSGHEGLGMVTQVGSDIQNVKVGDFVATRGEPAFSDYYNVRQHEFVVVPTAEPKYILEPVACGINLIFQEKYRFEKKQGASSRMLILGSGFLAWVAYQTVKIQGYLYDIDVVGTSNKDIWGDLLHENPTHKYDVVLDISSRADVFDKDILKENALVIVGSQKTVTTDFSNLLWNACSLIFPSPRNPQFIRCMHLAKLWVEKNLLVVDKFWTKSYNRDESWQQAFTDGADRPTNYSRGFIKWD